MSLLTDVMDRLTDIASLRVQVAELIVQQRKRIPFLQTAFPGSSQVALLGLKTATDEDIWRYEKEHHFVIISRDSDFH